SNDNIQSAFAPGGKLLLRFVIQFRNGAPGRFRTSTMLPSPDFESGASTSSATGAIGGDHSGGRPSVNVRAHGLLGRQFRTPTLCESRQGSRMIARSIALARTQPAGTAAAVIAAIGLAAILGAYFFQYVIGLPPCPLCLEQRIAYYISIPLAAMILLGLSVG